MNLQSIYEEFKNLADNAPEIFEKRYKEVIGEFISNFPPEKQKKLNDLQFIIDTERQLAKNPAEAFQNVVKILSDIIFGKNGLAEWNQKINEIDLKLKLLHYSSAAAKKD